LPAHGIAYGVEIDVGVLLAALCISRQATLRRAAR
jgi:hypothetical protein